jgi:class 3 adenylate cyclase
MTRTPMESDALVRRLAAARTEKQTPGGTVSWLPGFTPEQVARALEAGRERLVVLWPFGVAEATEAWNRIEAAMLAALEER